MPIEKRPPSAHEQTHPKQKGCPRLNSYCGPRGKLFGSHRTARGKQDPGCISLVIPGRTREPGRHKNPSWPGRSPNMDGCMATKTMHLSRHFVLYTTRRVIIPHPPCVCVCVCVSVCARQAQCSASIGRGTIGSTHVCPLHCVPWWRVVYNISSRSARTAGGSSGVAKCGPPLALRRPELHALKNTCPRAGPADGTSDILLEGTVWDVHHG